MLTKKQLYWLRRIGSDGPGMYPGERADFVPTKAWRALDRLGLVEWYYPHNIVHKERITITDKGRQVLSDIESATT